LGRNLRSIGRNHIRVALYTGIPLVLIGVWGRARLAVAAGGALALVLLSAWRNRWRRASLTTTLLYAVHVQFCQLPIWLGQLSYLRNRRRNVASEIIEYK
jgi:hypothetical protein